MYFIVITSNVTVSSFDQVARIPKRQNQLLSWFPSQKRTFQRKQVSFYEWCFYKFLLPTANLFYTVGEISDITKVYFSPLFFSYHNYSWDHTVIKADTI